MPLCCRYGCEPMPHALLYRRDGLCKVLASLDQVPSGVNSQYKPDHRHEQPPGRRAYTPPTLQVFGPVGALTQSGSGMGGEFNMMVCGPPPKSSNMC